MKVVGQNVAVRVACAFAFENCDIVVDRIRATVWGRCNIDCQRRRIGQAAFIYGCVSDCVGADKTRVWRIGNLAGFIVDLDCPIGRRWCPLDIQITAFGIGVIGQHVDQYRSAFRRVCDVIIGSWGCVVGILNDRLDALEGQRRAVCEGHGAGLRACVVCICGCIDRHRTRACQVKHVVVGVFVGAVAARDHIARTFGGRANDERVIAAFAEHGVGPFAANDRVIAAVAFGNFRELTIGPVTAHDDDGILARGNALDLETCDTTVIVVQQIAERRERARRRFVTGNHKGVAVVITNSLHPDVNELLPIVHREGDDGIVHDDQILRTIGVARRERGV